MVLQHQKYRKHACYKLNQDIIMNLLLNLIYKEMKELDLKNCY